MIVNVGKWPAAGCISTSFLGRPLQNSPRTQKPKYTVSGFRCISSDDKSPLGQLQINRETQRVVSEPTLIVPHSLIHFCMTRSGYTLTTARSEAVVCYWASTEYAVQLYNHHARCLYRAWFAEFPLWVHHTYVSLKRPFCTIFVVEGVCTSIVRLRLPCQESVRCWGIHGQRGGNRCKLFEWRVRNTVRSIFGM